MSFYNFYAFNLLLNHILEIYIFCRTTSVVEKLCLMEYDLTVDNEEEKEVDECFHNLLSGGNTTSIASATMLVIKTYQCTVLQSI